MPKKKQTRKRTPLSKKFIPQASIVSDELYLPNYSGIQNHNRIGEAVYGEICVEGNTNSDTIATGTQTQFLRFDTNGLSNNTAPDHDQDHIVIEKGGVYLVLVAVSFSGSASVDWSFHVHKNGGTVEFANLHFNRKLGAGGDIGSAGINGIINLNIGDTVELWMEHGAVGNKDITVQDCTLNVLKIA